MAPDATLKKRVASKTVDPDSLRRGAPFKCSAVRFSCVFQARLQVKIFSTLSARRGGAPLIDVTLGRGSQSDHARGPRESIGSSRRRAFLPVFPTVFNYEELSNPNSKLDSN